MTEDIKNKIFDISNQLFDNYKKQEIFKSLKEEMPRRDEIIQIINELKKILFPGFFGKENTLEFIYNKLLKQIEVAFSYKGNDVNDSKMAEKIALTFMNKLPYIQNMLLKDVEATLMGDPAANSKEEIILAYPGVFTIFVYRIAHELYLLNVPFIPRIMTEYAHSKTGIDINPGATIGEYFFIDHGTGIVIGETTVIGNNVKIYQGVTLGALSTRKGQELSGIKRHPTIEDNVVLYSNATVLGGNTIIGKNSVIAGNTFVVESISENTKVSATMPKLNLKVEK